MARDPRIEARLHAWAQWMTTGDGSGFPTMSVLHPAWTPPSPGVMPTLKVSAPSGARQTHRAVRQLSMRLANTLVVHYCLKLPLCQQAERLGCSERTVLGRVELSHQKLRALLGARELLQQA
jgi:DNA-directed RNA polymerase specialized sigma24 family protein